MRFILWTEQAQADLAAIHAFIGQESAHYASVTVRQLIAAVDWLAGFPESGRAVPEFEDSHVREVSAASRGMQPANPEATLPLVRRNYSGPVEFGEDSMTIEVGDQVEVRRLAPGR